MNPQTLAALLKGLTKKQIEQLFTEYLKETPYSIQLVAKPTTQLTLYEEESLH